MNPIPKRIALLGSGWLGLPLATTLQSQGHTISASSRTREKIELLAAFGLSPYFIDVSQENSLPKAFFEADVLIITITSKSIEEHQRITEHIESSPIQQVIYTSSTSVYPSASGMTDEESATEDDHPLRQIEQLYQALPQASCILRLAGLVGPDRHPGRFFRKRPEAALARVPSNLVHLRDVLAVFDWLMARLPAEDVFNLVSDEHPLKFDFYSAAYEDYFGQASRFQLAAPEDSNGSKTIANHKIKAASGLSFRLADYYPYAAP